MTDSGRILGIDAGERRIGVAISDPGGTFALPLNSVAADGGEFDALKRIAEAENVTELVIGLPLSLSGDDTSQTARARAFADKVAEHVGLPVEMWDERLSSRQAEQMTSPETRGGGRGRGRGRGNSAGPDLDAVAASVILQAYLDSRRFGAG